MTTIFAVLGFIKAPDALPDLTTGWKWGLTIAMAIAILGAAWSIAMGGVASVVSFNETNAQDAEGLSVELLKVGKTIRDAIYDSRIGAVVAFAAVSVGIGIVYLAPTEPPRYFLPVDVATGTDYTVCGVLSVNETTGAIELKPETDPAIAAVPVPDTSKLVVRDGGCR